VAGILYAAVFLALTAILTVPAGSDCAVAGKVKTVKTSTVRIVQSEFCIVIEGWPPRQEFLDEVASGSPDLPAQSDPPPSPLPFSLFPFRAAEREPLLAYSEPPPELDLRAWQSQGSVGLRNLPLAHQQITHSYIRLGMIWLLLQHGS